MLNHHARTSQPTSNQQHALSLATEGFLYVHLPGNQGHDLVLPPVDAFVPAEFRNFVNQLKHRSG